jgi:NADPH:quinone reductase-like Zn-dependent oxidoreductase
MLYLQAYYSLVLAARMKQGQRIMIHAGWTNVGQAAITLALDFNCTVFTTVANQEQRAFIRCRFPQVSVICNGGIEKKTVKKVEKERNNKTCL